MVALEDEVANSLPKSDSNQPAIAGEEGKKDQFADISGDSDSLGSHITQTAETKRTIATSEIILPLTSISKSSTIATTTASSTAIPKKGGGCGAGGSKKTRPISYAQQSIHYE